MADSSISISFKADASEAQHVIEELEQKAQAVAAVAQAAAGAQEGAPSAAGASVGAAALNSGAQQAKQMQVVAKEGEAFGRNAGKVLGSLFVSTVVGGGALKFLELSRDPLSSNRKQDVAQGGVTGALGGGALGWGAMAMMGANPLLGAATAGLTAAIGGLIGVISEQKRANDAEKRLAFARSSENAASVTALGASFSEYAFSSLLEMSGGDRNGRLAMMETRRAATRKNLEAVQDEIIAYEKKGVASGDVRYDRLRNRERELIGRINSQTLDIFKEATKVPFGFINGSEVADSLQAQGINIGGKVDVSAVNTRATDLLEDIKLILERYAAITPGQEYREGMYLHTGNATFK